jgi:hypothetical protein
MVAEQSKVEDVRPAACISNGAQKREKALANEGAASYLSAELTAQSCFLPWLCAFTPFFLFQRCSPSRFEREGFFRKGGCP